MSFIPYDKAPELSGLLSEINTHEYMHMVNHIGEAGILAGFEEEEIGVQAVAQLSDDELRVWEQGKEAYDDSQTPPTPAQQLFTAETKAHGYVSGLFGELDGYELGIVVASHFSLLSGGVFEEGESSIEITPIERGLEVRKRFYQVDWEHMDQGPLRNEDQPVTAEDHDLVMRAIERLQEVNTKLQSK